MLGLEADASEAGKELAGQEEKWKREQGGRRAIRGRELSDKVTDPGRQQLRPGRGAGTQD